MVNLEYPLPPGSHIVRKMSVLSQSSLQSAVKLTEIHSNFLTLKESLGIFHGCFGALGDDFLSASRQWPDTKDVMRGISWFSRLKSYNRRALYIPGHTVLVGRKFRLRGKNICNNETSAAWGLPCSCLSYTRDKTRFSLETDPISVGVTGRTAS